MHVLCHVCSEHVQMYCDHWYTMRVYTTSTLFVLALKNLHTYVCTFSIDHLNMYLMCCDKELINLCVCLMMRAEYASSHMYQTNVMHDQSVSTP